MSIKHDLIWNPITALEFYQRGATLLILAGEGPYLNVFDARTSKLLAQCEIFHGQAIHGIATQKCLKSPASLQLVIWGGPHVQLLRSSQFEQLLSQELSCIKDGSTLLSDWVLEASISPVDPFSCALVTAHNAIIRARLDETTNKVTLDTESSPSRSILYSAYLTWESENVILVAAGTVFGEIIVWECSLDGNHKILWTFTGHEGSIFGVNISPPILQPDGAQIRLLASCSDDRTIRIWDLGPESIHAVARSILRETGFGPRDAPLPENNMPVSVVMAHASRIWRVEFIVGEASPEGQISVAFMSFGEDATAIHWLLDFATSHENEDSYDSRKASGRQTLQGNVHHLQTYDFHSGKHIWAPAIHQDGKRTFVATGGADGKISMYQLGSRKLLALPSSKQMGLAQHSPLSETLSRSDSDSWALEEVLNRLQATEEPKAEASGPVVDEEQLTIPPETVGGKSVKKKKPKKVSKDSFNRYAFISQHDFLLTTTFGRVLQGHIAETTQWTEVGLPDSSKHDLKSYSVVVGFPEVHLAFFAGANGKIFRYQMGSAMLVELANVEGKVADMFKVFDTETKTYALLVTVLMSQTAHLFVIEQDIPRIAGEFEFTLPERFVATSAGLINLVLVLGSRSGSLALYDFSRPETPLNIYKSTNHSVEDAITSIVPLPTIVDAYLATPFLTTSRDGVFTIFSLTKTLTPISTIEKISLTTVHHGNPSIGPIIESAWFTPTKDLILYGFKSKSFILWNHTTSSEITRVECGGAHRSYAYSTFTSFDGGHLVYTKASRLYVHTYHSDSHTIIKPGGHGREIKAGAVSPDQKFLATGAEDTALRIWSHTPSSPSSPSTMKAEILIQKHTTGIQHLQFHSSPSGAEYLCTSGGNEEFFIFALSCIPSFGLGAICIASTPELSAERDLRIMNFDICNAPSWEGMLISLAFSDSTVRVYVWDREKGYKRLGEGRYTSSCITQLKYLEVDDMDAYLLTASTDGYLAIWHLPFPRPRSVPGQEPDQAATMKALKTVRVHQNTIKCLALRKLRDGKTVVLTGGDDGALGITILPVCSHGPAIYTNQNPVVSILRSAHAAAITGLDIISVFEEKEGCEVRVVSSSNDQRIKTWVIQLLRGGEVEGERGEEEVRVKIRLEANEFASVPDVGDVCVFRPQIETGGKNERGTKVLLVGNGMEVWDVS